MVLTTFFFFSSRRRHTRLQGDWSSDVCSSDLYRNLEIGEVPFLENPLVQADALSARLTALKVLGRYVLHLLWPAALSCDYSYDAIPLVAWPPTRWEDWQGFLALAGLV